LVPWFCRLLDTSCTSHPACMWVLAWAMEAEQADPRSEEAAELAQVEAVPRSEEGPAMAVELADPRSVEGPDLGDLVSEPAAE
jgi:hypothetical protein